jgi:predicted transcriptional regulator of viral defense system
MQKRRQLLTKADVVGYIPPMRKYMKKPEAPAIFRLSEVDQAGLTRGRLRGMLQRGEAQKVGRGLYRRGSEVTELDTVAMVCARVPRAVVCLLTALLIHRIGTQLPADVWIALDRKARKPRVEDLPIRIVRFSPTMLRQGIEERRVHGVVIRLTSPARTVVDCFRYRNKTGIDVAIEALRESLRERRTTVDAIVRAAKVGRVYSVMKPYLQAIVA